MARKAELLLTLESPIVIAIGAILMIAASWSGSERAGAWRGETFR
jgi:hypothetical protein